MKNNNFQNYDPIDLLIEERTFQEIRKFKKEYDTRLKTLSLKDGVKELRPKKDWIKNTYSVLSRYYTDDKSLFNDNQIYHANWFRDTFHPLGRLVRELDYSFVDDLIPDPIVSIDQWCNDALYLLRSNWGESNNFKILNGDPVDVSKLGNFSTPKQVIGKCYDQANQIYNNWFYVDRSGQEWELRWRECIHIYRVFMAHFDPEHKLENSWLLSKYPELTEWANRPEIIPDKEEFEAGLKLNQIYQNKPRILKKIMSNGTEVIATDTEHLNWIKNDKPTHINPVESMTNSKLEILEAGFAAIKDIKRPAEKRLALLDLSKKLQLPQGELSKLIQELSIEKSQVNNQFETFSSVMNADLEQEVLVDKLIMSGTISMVAAESGTGKSSLIYQIMESVSTGSPLFDMFTTKQCNVHVIQVDESYVNARRKWQRMQLKPDPSKVSFCWEWSPTQMEELEQKIITKNIGLCFMDSFGKLFGASGDMNTIEAGYYMYELNNIAAKTGCAFVVAHHLKKDQSKHKKDSQPRIPSLGDFFGSSYIIAGVRDAWGLWQKGEDTDGTPLYGLRYLKDNSGLIDKGWTFNLSGCLESQRFHLLGNKGGLDELEERQNIKSKLHLLLKSRTPDWLSVEQLHEGICTKKTFTGMGDKVDIKSVKKELLALVDDAARTGIERMAVKSENRGRPRYKYRYVC